VANKSDHPIVELPNQAAWGEWLEANHVDADGVWLKFAKKGTGVTTVTYSEAVEEALCYGWIDGQAAGHDETYYLQRFTPRRRRSKWSRINREKATRLIGARRMKPAGLAQVESAKADGRWDAAYESPSTATVPEDLKAAMDQNPKAKAFFESLSSQNRYAILYRIQDAKRPETRAKRIAQFVQMLSEHKTLH
jgi:uncharacterized protein YdeI (YjbR/CyaY-like superfamily)